MRITFTKGKLRDGIVLVRDNGVESRFEFPKKGPTPHDAFHYFVERGLGLERGFWGLVSAGVEPEEVGAMAAAAGHASAKRAQVPDSTIVELLQAERLVECFEAESWSGDASNEGIRAMAEAGWATSHVPPIVLKDAKVAEIRGGIGKFGAEWSALPLGGSLVLVWPE